MAEGETAVATKKWALSEPLEQSSPEGPTRRALEKDFVYYKYSWYILPNQVKPSWMTLIRAAVSKGSINRAAGYGGPDLCVIPYGQAK